jgi:hypothetical protein
MGLEKFNHIAVHCNKDFLFGEVRINIDYFIDLPDEVPHEIGEILLPDPMFQRTPECIICPALFGPGFFPDRLQECFRFLSHLLFLRSF